MASNDGKTEQTARGVETAMRVYGLPAWADGYFDILPDGHLAARPRRGDDAVRLITVVNRLRAEFGLSPPCLLRFLDILRGRVAELRSAFDQARGAHDYPAPFHPVYPVKVNQRRDVVRTLLENGGKNVGLEVGSKPELMQALALAPDGALIVCNGYKDEGYIRLALTGQRLGFQVFLVIEKFAELQTVLDTAADMGVTPTLGLRARLLATAGGKWQNTGGWKSKFGLYAAEISRAVKTLANAGALSRLRLLHYHIGSQIPDIRHFQNALLEGSRYYAALRRLGAPIEYVDVGGGLAVDYDGTASDSPFSMNYTLSEYADNVIQAFSRVCSEQRLPAPALITECGRAMTAHHAVMVTNVISVERPPLPEPVSIDEDTPAPIREMAALCPDSGTDGPLSVDDATRLHHEAERRRWEAHELFTKGLLSLDDVATVERLYYMACRRAHDVLAPRRHPLAATLSVILADKHYGNFSLFQTIPDAWGLGQTFPIAPLSGLHLPPGRRATLHDLTCDADGRVDRYACHGKVEKTLPTRGLEDGEPYHLGVFLVGAYQEILGDIHNMFGEVASVNVELADNPDGYRLTNARPGSTGADLLRRVDMEPERMLEEYRRGAARAGLSERQTRACLDVMKDGLYGYTYLDPPM